MTDTVHLLPGRLRLRLAALRRNPALARRLERALAAECGVGEVRANPLTGSLLVHYDPGCAAPSRLAARLAAEGVAWPGHGAPGPFGELAARRLGEAAAGLALEELVRRSAAVLLAALV